MNKYKIVKTLGEGSFGSVFEAQNLKTKEKVLFLCVTSYLNFCLKDIRKT